MLADLEDDHVKMDPEDEEDEDDENEDDDDDENENDPDNHDDFMDVLVSVVAPFSPLFGAFLFS